MSADTVTIKELADAAHAFQLGNGREPTLMETIQEVQDRRDDEQRHYIQVTYVSGGMRYTYACSGCAVGDYVVLPPALYRDDPHVQRVAALGRGEYDGPIKKALRLPDWLTP